MRRVIGTVLGSALLVAVPLLGIAPTAAADHTDSEVGYVAGSYPFVVPAGVAVCQSEDFGTPGVGGGCQVDVPDDSAGVVTITVDDAFWGSSMAFYFEGRNDDGEFCEVAGNEASGDGEFTDGVATASIEGTDCTHFSVWPDATGTQGTITLS